MQSKLVFSALLLTVAAVFCVALFQGSGVSNFKKHNSRRHFFVKADFEASLPKLVTAVGGTGDVATGKALFRLPVATVALPLALKPTTEKGCGAAATTTIGDIYLKGISTLPADKCLHDLYIRQETLDLDDLSALKRTLKAAIKKEEAAITDADLSTKADRFVAQARISRAVCEVPYAKLTLEVLKDTSKDATNKECLEIIKTKLTDPVYASYKAEVEAAVTAYKADVATKKTAVGPQVQTDCETSCTVGTDAEKSTCKTTTCKAEVDQTSEPLAKLWRRVSRLCPESVLTPSKEYTDLKKLYKDNNACVVEQAKRSRELANNGLKLFVSALAILALMIFGF